MPILQIGRKSGAQKRETTCLKSHHEAVVHYGYCCHCEQLLLISFDPHSSKCQFYVHFADEDTEAQGLTKTQNKPWVSWLQPCAVGTIVPIS